MTTAVEVAPLDAAMDEYGIVLIVTDEDAEEDYVSALRQFMEQTEDTRDTRFVTNYRQFTDGSWIWTIGTKSNLHHNQLARLYRLHEDGGF